MTDDRRGPTTVTAEYFDGLSARAYPVRVSRRGEALHIEGAGIDTEFSLDDLEWPERTRHGTRVVHRSDGASIQAEDSDVWDEFARACGHGDSPVVRAQQSWRWVTVSLVAVVVVLAATYQWGLPWAARAAVAFVPPRVESEIGAAALQTLDRHLLQPSKLPLERQLLLRVAFERALSVQPTGLGAGAPPGVPRQPHRPERLRLAGRDHRDDRRTGRPGRRRPARDRGRAGP